MNKLQILSISVLICSTSALADDFDAGLRASVTRSLEQSHRGPASTHSNKKGENSKQATGDRPDQNVMTGPQTKKNKAATIKHAALQQVALKNAPTKKKGR